MEVIAGLLTSAVVKIAEDKLSSAVKEQASLCWNFGDDLENMKGTMVSIAAVLADAERQSVKKDSESMRWWLKRLKHAALDISDMMDDYFQEDTGIGSSQKVPGMLSCFTAAPKRIVLANKMKNMRDKLERINKERQDYTFAESTSAGQDQRQLSAAEYQQRETASGVDETKIIGRDGVKKEIINILSANNREEGGTRVLPIYGLGGMGKSTMAQLVYNDAEFIKHYEHWVWVYVSEVFDLKKIGRSIISQLPIDGSGHHNPDTLQMIYSFLDKQLPGKKILIILDDIWQEDASELDKLKCMLHVGKKGSMVDVLVTTRTESIANKICTSQVYKLPPLADNVCWDIIKQHSGYEEKSNKKKLEEIGLDIAKKCGGVALAAQALGYVLKEEDLDGWSKMNKSDIWNESFGGDDKSPHKKVLPSLKLSYEWMPPMLRLCFSYCAIFRKGHDIYEDDLIHQWTALDFIKKSAEGRKYVKQLLGMSFLQHTKLPITSNETVTRYTMHDLVHDLARSVVGDELIVIDSAKEVKTSEQKYCRYAILMNYAGQTKLSAILPKKVRALHFSSCSKMDLRDSSFSFMKRLGILDFSGCSGIQLPSSIDQLKQLKCLIAPQLQGKSLPEALGELSKLQYLNLRGSSLISELPLSIGKLSCLIYLGLSGCSGILKVPDSIGGLKNLVHLDMSNCSGITRLPGTLGSLTNLQHLDLSRCSDLVEIPESLGDLNELLQLNVSYCGSIKRLPEAIGKLNKLQYLDLKYNERIRELPRSFQDLQYLVHLDLSHCSCGKGLPEALRGLNSLEHLNMSGFQDYREELWKNISDAMGNLINLKYLNLKSAGNFSSSDCIGFLTNLEHLDLSWRPIVSLPENMGNLKKLRTLNLTRCDRLKSLPDSISEITVLESLLIQGCSDELVEMANSKLHYSLTLPYFKVRAGVDGSCSNLPLLEGANVTKLKIHSLENARSVEEARKTKLSDKEKLTDLQLYWTSLDADRVVDDEDLLRELVPPGCLQHFDLGHYRGESFPMWLVDISHHLPNLVIIRLFDLPKINNLPPLGQLQRLKELSLINCHSVTKIGKDFCGGKGAFPRLSVFLLGSMEGLEEWCTKYSDSDGVDRFMFPLLDKLYIEECKKLRLTPCAPVCSDCIINDSDGVISSLEELGTNIGRVTKLSIHFTNHKSLRLFHQLTALQELEISYCSNLTGLPDSMRCLTSLQSLKLDLCMNISSLPDWLSDLSSLRSLNIVNCSSIESLPPCIRLHTLRVEGCPELQRWCKSEENRKLAHVNNIIYEDSSPWYRMMEAKVNQFCEKLTQLENILTQCEESSSIPSTTFGDEESVVSLSSALPVTGPSPPGLSQAQSDSC